MIPMGGMYSPQPPNWDEHVAQDEERARETGEIARRTGTPLTESERKALEGPVPISYYVILIIILLFCIFAVLGTVFHLW